MRTESEIAAERRMAPRLQRSAVAVMAQYINDLTRAANLAPCLPKG